MVFVRCALRKKSLVQVLVYECKQKIENSRTSPIALGKIGARVVTQVILRRIIAKDILLKKLKKA